MPLTRFQSFKVFSAIIIATLLLLSLTIFVVLHKYASSSSDHNFELISDGIAFKVSPSYVDHSAKTGLFIVKGNFVFNGSGTEIVTITPDDCLRSLSFNGIEIRPLADENWCDYDRGFQRIADSILRNGKNEFVAEVENFSGPRKFNIGINLGSNSESVLLLTALYLLAAIWTLLLERWLGLATVSKIALRSLTVISLLYLSMTAPDQRTYDVFEGGGHADFIKFIAEQGDLPEVGTGWEYHQPPLYYLTAAALLRIIGPFPAGVPWEIFQGMNWVIFQLFIAIGLRVFKENLSASSLTLASFLFALWPMNPAHAARIGNDTLLYLFLTCSILYWLRWCKKGELGDFICVSLYLGLGCFTKNTALPGVAAFVFIGLLTLIQSIFPKRCRFAHQFLPEIPSGRQKFATLVLISILVLVSAASLYSKFIFSKGESTEDFLFPGINASIGLYIPISAKTFVPFSSAVGAFEPFISPWIDESGRNNFWTYLFKSAQTGELSSRDWYGELFAQIYLFGSYGLLVLILIGLFAGLWKRRPETFMLATLLFSCFSALIVSTIVQPHASKQDFRYVHFLLVPLIIMMMAGFRSLPKFVKAIAIFVVFSVIVAGNCLLITIAMT